MATAKIFGVEILNEGWGSLIDHAVSEMRATFVAREGGPMHVETSSFPPSSPIASFSLPLPG